MNSLDSIKTAKKKSEGIYNSLDGILDIVLGIVIIVATASIFFKLVPYTSFTFLLLYFLIRFMKKKYTYPRIGYATYKYSKEKLTKSLLAFTLMGVVVLMVMLFLYSDIIRFGNKDDISRYAPIFLGVFFSSIVFVIGKVIINKRFYFYSILLLISFLLIYIIDKEGTAKITLLSCGSLILIIGIVIFSRFIKNNPVLAKEAEDGNR